MKIKLLRAMVDRMIEGGAGTRGFEYFGDHTVYKSKATVSGIDTLAIDCAADRADLDFRKLETPDDCSYYGVWFSPKSLEILTYVEGDVCFERYSPRHDANRLETDGFYAGLGRHCDFHGVPVLSILNPPIHFGRTQ